MAFVAGSDLSAKTARAFHGFLFAIETGMRAGEIVKLTPEYADIAHGYLFGVRDHNMLMQS
ncbi:MAG: hypothetical protein ABJ360_16910 [Roseobacter sp.]